MLGINAFIYRNTATFGAPTWSAVTYFEQVNVDPRYTVAPSNSRDSRFERGVPTLAGAGLRGRLKNVIADTNVVAILDAFALTTVVDLLVLNASETTVGARGFRGEFYVIAAGEDQGPTSRLYYDLEFVFADGANLPKWAKVGAGPAIQYAAPGGAFA